MLKRENVLIEALPYIREFSDSIMVIKMGGHAIVNPVIITCQIDSSRVPAINVDMPMQEGTNALIVAFGLTR